MKIRHHIIFSLIAALLSGTVLSSCSSGGSSTSQEPDQSGATATITININAVNSGQSATRATENFTDPELTESETSANELINNWLVAFYKTDATGNYGLEKVIKGKPGSGGTSGAHGVQSDRASVELQSGTYIALAFVNIDQDKAEQSLNSTLAEGWVDEIFNEDIGASDNSLIPMSGYKESFAIRGVNEIINIEVIRMKAKIEFAVKNSSSQAIDVRAFTLAPVYNGPIYLFPNYEEKPNPDTLYPENAPRFPTLAENLPNPYISIEEAAPSGFILTANSSEIKRENFYIKESIATGNHPTGHFHIGLKLKRGESATEDVTYALAADGLQFIYRNDYILFPIVISDYVPEFEVIDFPPIGGYPVKMEAQNNEFYAKFSSSGAFDISARLRDSQGRTVALQQYDGTGAQENYVRYLGRVDANGNVSTTDFPLTYDIALGTWQGNFTQGTNQRIILKFQFKIGNLLYERTLHLISK